MQEPTSNIDFAHKIHEQGDPHPSATDRRMRWVEFAEAVVLAIVAIATAWSGYQAAQWDALSAQHYDLSSITIVISHEKATLAGQERLYDITTFNAWVAARLAGRDKLVAFYQRRFRPEYATAFAAWLKLDPINNPNAPPGPDFMAEYTNANSQQSAKLAAEAHSQFEKGVSTRDIGDRYVKVTVFLATVLFLTALGQRFEILRARVAVVAVTFVLLVISTLWILALPRA